jgi:predicted transcriptional regulator
MNVKRMTAGQLMTKELITIEPRESLRAAAVALNKHHIHCLLVPASDPQRLVGIITVKDIVQVLCEGEPALLDQLVVQDAMTTPAVSVQKDFSIADCLRLMRAGGVRTAAVLEGTRLVGLLSFSDVLRAVALEPQDTTGHNP